MTRNTDLAAVSIADLSDTAWKRRATRVATCRRAAARQATLTLTILILDRVVSLHDQSWK